MKTIEVNLYAFNELSENSKKNAIQNYIDSKLFTEFDDNEILKSFKEAKEIYDSLENIEGEIKGARLYTWLINNVYNEWLKPNYIFFNEDKTFINDYFSFKYAKSKYKKSNICFTNTFGECPLSGVIWDFDFLQPIFDFIKNPDSTISNFDLAKLLPSYEDISQNNYEQQREDENIIYLILDNEIEFYQNGEIYEK